MTEMNTTTDAPEIADAPQATTAKSPPPPAHRINLEPAFRVDPRNGRATGQGKAVMVYNGQVIGESKEPAFAAARYLLANGLALPSDRLAAYRNGLPCLFSTVGRCAKLAVAETGKSGPRIIAYREPPIETLRALSAAPSKS